MASELRVDYLSPEVLRTKANDFLSRYHNSGSIPVPIEDIVDLHFRIDIVPVPGLRRSFDVEAFITSDMETIYVDDDVYSNHENRYRFTLAHELAHAVLHQKIFRTVSFNDIKSWKRIQRELPEKEYQWLETQAYIFAGLVLVPSGQLRASYQRAVEKAEQVGVSLQYASEVAQRMIAGHIAVEFQVSTSVIERRLNADGIWKK